MQRRPQPNRRRGILRALGAVIVLIVVIVAVLLVVASLTAPAAKAPTPPVTPGVTTPLPSAGTVVVPTRGAVTPSSKTPGVVRTPTSGKKKGGAIGSGRAVSDRRLSRLTSSPRLETTLNASGAVGGPAARELKD